MDMLQISDLLLFIKREILQNKKRFFLTISGIVIGIFVFTFFLFVSQGLSSAIEGQFSSLGKNVIVIRPESQADSGPPGGEGLDDTDVAKIRQVARKVKYIAPQIFYSSGQYEFKREKDFIVTLGMPDEFLEDVSSDLGIKMSQGRFLRKNDRGSIVIGHKVAHNTFDDLVSVGDSLRVEDRKLKVVGVIKSRGDLFIDSSIYANFEDIKEISGQDTYTSVRVSFHEGADVEEQMQAILKKFNPSGKKKRIQISSPKQAIEQFNSIIGVLTLIIGTISGVALIVGGINIMNIMFSNAIEKTTTISTLKALGGTYNDIRNLFIIESAIYGTCGALIGFFLSFGLAKILAYLSTNFAGYTIIIDFELEFFLGIVFTTTLLAIIFGTYPALKAAKINPADNLRDE